jgi:hypothetical protein
MSVLENPWKKFKTYSHMIGSGAEAAGLVLMGVLVRRRSGLLDRDCVRFLDLEWRGDLDLLWRLSGLLKG